jgi:hypothetical protein
VGKTRSCWWGRADWGRAGAVAGRGGEIGVDVVGNRGVGVDVLCGWGLGVCVGMVRRRGGGVWVMRGGSCVGGKSGWEAG